MIVCYLKLLLNSQNKWHWGKPVGYKKTTNYQRLSLQTIEKQNTLKKSNFIHTNYEQQEWVFLLFLKLHLNGGTCRSVHCQYKYGRWFLNDSFIPQWEVLFSIVLTGN